MNKPIHWIARPNTSSEYIFYNRSKGIITQNKPQNISDGELFTSTSFLAQAPLKVYFDITYRCNLQCKHCITSSSLYVDNTPELPTQRILEIITELAEIGVLEIEIGGGEPLTHPDWPLIAQHIRDSGMNLIINTNGLLLNEKNIQFLNIIQPLEMCISFDGGRSFHNDMWGRDTYDRALYGLKNLIQNGHNATAHFTYCFGVEFELEEMFEDIAATGCKNIKIAMLKKAGRALNNPNLTPKIPDLDIIHWLIDLGKKLGLTVQLSSDDFPKQYPNTEDTKRQNSETCYISPYGQVYNSITIPTIEFGILHNESFLKAWQRQTANQYMES
jgi:MoaA/NifB/PqqE/SkfB family radical SAM enzyme